MDLLHPFHWPRRHSPPPSLNCKPPGTVPASEPYNSAPATTSTPFSKGGEDQLSIWSSASTLLALLKSMPRADFPDRANETLLSALSSELLKIAGSQETQQPTTATDWGAAIPGAAATPSNGDVQVLLSIETLKEMLQSVRTLTKDGGFLLQHQLPVEFAAQLRIPSDNIFRTTRLRID